MNLEMQQGIVSTRGRGITVSLLILCLSIQAIGTGALALFLPIIREDLSLSFTQAGTLSASTLLLYAVMQIPAGYLADRFGPKRVFFIGILGATALALVFGFISLYWQALANRAFSGFFRALLFSPGLALLSGWFGSERWATAMGLYLMGSFGGQIFLNVVGPLLVIKFDWRFPFVTFGLTGMLIAFTYLWFGKEAPRAGSQQRVNISDIFKLLRSRFMWLCGVIQYARAAVLQGIAFWLPTFLIVDRGLSLQVTGLIIALRALFIGPSSVVGGYVSDKLNNPPVVIGFSFVILAITTALLVVVDNIVLLVVIIGINSLFINCYFGPQFALPLEVLGSHTRGTTTGVGNFFANLGAFSFVYLMGALRDVSGSFDSGFYTITGAAVFGLVFTLWVARARRNAIAPMT
ncbi:MFS transporter [Chloroflexota bacterium]